MDKKLPYPFGWATNIVTVISGALIVVVVSSVKFYRNRIIEFLGSKFECSEYCADPNGGKRDSDFQSI